MNRIRLLLNLAPIFLAACATTAVVPQPVIPDDPSSFSNPSEVVVRHLDLSLAVDFERRRLHGWAGLHIENLTDAKELIVDTSALDIQRVSLDGEPTTFRLGEHHPRFGSPLHIALRPGARVVRIDYSSGPDAGALQWLEPAQTAGGKHPFLFTQSQPRARSWIPLQDTPAVRFTYSATVRVPPQLIALMSAENPRQKRADGLYEFRMPQPIPSYLMALAVGDLAFKAFDSRSGVFAEPEVIGKAAWEFEDTPRMMTAAEQLYGPYRWGRYDILVLPPSFPFGGMENPRLTFVTPTLIAGDRSLVATIAHELAHSWSGNLVTNAAWNDAWLNEGFTSYFEHRIVEAVYGREFAEMAAILEERALRSTVATLGETSPRTRLHLDPVDNEGGLGVAYEKGHFFLRALEERVGREQFDRFLRRYFDTYAFRTMTSDAFVQYVDQTLAKGDPALQAMVREWVYGTGIPASMPRPRSAAFEAVGEAARAFVAGSVTAAQLPAQKWSAQEWLQFIALLPETPTPEQMTALDAQFHLTESGNSEILFAWFQRAIRAWYEPAFPAMERYLTGIGRIKFVYPLYQELAKSDRGRQWAERVYKAARPHYHPMTQGTVDRALAKGK